MQKGGLRFHISPSKGSSMKGIPYLEEKIQREHLQLVANSFFENEREHIFLVNKEKGTPFKE